MSKANEQSLSGLHYKLAEVLTEAIAEGIPLINTDGAAILDKEGKPLRAPAPAAILNVARQFLKDNKIEAIAAQGSPLHSLADLPVFDDDNIIHIRKAN